MRPAVPADSGLHVSRETPTMARPLPLALVQAQTLPAHTPLSVFTDDVQKVLCDFPQTRLVVYPELHLTGLGGDAAQREAVMREVAESLDGPRMRSLRELAGDLGVWLLPGTVYERDPEDGSIYNTAVLLSPDGELAASYRKVFPWRPYERCRPGGRFVVADMAGFGRVGLSICYDSWFPEAARHLAWMGAEVILNPTLTPTADRAQELVLARAQAITNQVYVVGVNAAAPTARGRSLVVDPEGIVRVEAGEAPAVLTDVLDLGHVSTVRRYGTSALNRMWQQMEPGDRPIELPLYRGRIDPDTWPPTPRSP
jgi:predicted amidohydrolase